MLVPAKPQLELRTLIQAGGETFVSPWDQVAFFSSGNDALIAGLDRLDLPDKATVVLPAFICGSVPERLTRQGYRVRFVDSPEHSPFPDPEWMLQQAEEASFDALLMVDFFGFLPPQRERMAQRVRELGGILIEDRCHSALTRPCEEVAHAVIYSIRKSVPSADGGALWMRQGVGSEERLAPAALPQSAVTMVARVLERLVCTLGWPNIYSDSITGARRGHETDTPVDLQTETPRPSHPSWLLSRYLQNAKLLARSARQRADNYRTLAHALADYPFLLEWREDGSVPQVLPLLDPAGGLADFLRGQGVGAYRWPGPELPQYVAERPDQFPNACLLNQQMVCLPIHQSIRERDIERMVKLIERYRGTAT